MINFETPNAVIVSFPAFSGGKFISNCLSLSSNTIFTDPHSADYLLANPQDYSKRLEVAKSTLPQKDNLLNWRNYEFSNKSFYGDDFTNWIHTGTVNVANINQVVEEVTNSKVTFFMIDHSGPPTLNKLIQVWPNATVIRLINSRLFQSMCVKLKSDTVSLSDINGNYCIEKYDILAGQDGPSWKQFQQEGFRIDKFDGVTEFTHNMLAEHYPWHTIYNKVILFDIDSCIFDSNKFLHAVSGLYQNLGFNDFAPARILDFYKSYISLHY